jgi:hypothetical protein
MSLGARTENRACSVFTTESLFAVAAMKNEKRWEEKEQKKNLVEYIGVVNQPIYATRRVMIPWQSQRSGTIRMRWHNGR